MLCNQHITASHNIIIAELKERIMELIPRQHSIWLDAFLKSTPTHILSLFEYLFE